jgi:hypothetical protein
LHSCRIWGSHRVSYGKIWIYAIQSVESQHIFWKNILPPFSGSTNKQSIFYYYYLVCEAIGTAATPSLLCQPRVIVKMIVEKQIECRLAGETEVLGENLPQCHFCLSQNPTWPDPSLNPGRRGGKPATGLTSYTFQAQSEDSILLRNVDIQLQDGITVQKPAI